MSWPTIAILDSGWQSRRKRGGQKSDNVFKASRREGSGEKISNSVETQQHQCQTVCTHNKTPSAAAPKQLLKTVGQCSRGFGIYIQPENRSLKSSCSASQSCSLQLFFFLLSISMSTVRRKKGNSDLEIFTTSTSQEDFFLFKKNAMIISGQHHAVFSF